MFALMLLLVIAISFSLYDAIVPDNNNQLKQLGAKLDWLVCTRGVDEIKECPRQTPNRNMHIMTLDKDLALVAFSKKGEVITVEETNTYKSTVSPSIGIKINYISPCDGACICFTKTKPGDNKIPRSSCEDILLSDVIISRLDKGEDLEEQVTSVTQGASPGAPPVITSASGTKIISNISLPRNNDEIPVVIRSNMLPGQDGDKLTIIYLEYAPSNIPSKPAKILITPYSDTVKDIIRGRFATIP